MTERVAITPQAAELLRGLRDSHGPLMFHQSGGCCDGSAPMCFTQGTFITSAADVHLGDLDIGLAANDDAGIVPVWISREQFGYWSHTHITIDVVPGPRGRLLPGRTHRKPIHHSLTRLHRRGIRHFDPRHLRSAPLSSRGEP